MLRRALVWLVVLGCGSPRATDEPKRDLSPPSTMPAPQGPPAPKPPATKPPAIAMLESASWGDVTKARTLLVGDRLASLAAVVEMVDRDDRVPLTGTADLIYPGAKQFYGHGYALPHDLDHLRHRAGW